jgi:predicted dehydrogenase
LNAPVKVALVGISGYGAFYLRQLLAPTARERIQFVAAIDPFPERSTFLDPLARADIPIYPDLEAFYAANFADLVVIAAPIHLHAPLTCLALSHGSNVLCEKPLCATIQEAHQVIQAEREAGKFVAIGYQWSFSEAIQQLKQDIRAGRLGRPVRLKTRVFWPRWQPYYQRNQWAGKIRLPDGRWVLDSPVNNATAHYLHNMLYLLGETRETSAKLASVQAELYRANAIENYDTAALRCYAEPGVEILFYTAHPVATTANPIFHFEFERAVVDYDANGEGRIVAAFQDGRRQDYGDPFADNARKLWQSVSAVRTGEPLPCGAEAAMAQTLCMNGAQESMPHIVNFPPDLIRTEGDRGWVAELEEALRQCYEQNLLPAAYGEFAWAKSGEVVNLQNYHSFPSLRKEYLP